MIQEQAGFGRNWRLFAKPIHKGCNWYKLAGNRVVCLISAESYAKKTMSTHLNHLDQPVGFPVPNWQPCQPPPRTAMTGSYCRLEALDPDSHAEQLYHAYVAERHDGDWTYLPYGPYDSFEPYRSWVESVYDVDDPVFFAIIDLKTDKAVGVASYLRIAPAIGSIEVGHIHYSPMLQKQPAATEAMFLMMRRAFDELGYRRYEWKCDSLNAPSRKAAQRLGFSYEGLFRQAAMYKGRSRDTTWFSIIDEEWPGIKSAFEAWLAPSNFDASGQQKARLDDLIAQRRA